MMEQPLISVIVPVYNTEQYLERCLLSITGQSYHNLEILLTEMGTEDDSARLCDEWAARDSRIRVFHSPDNRGVSVSRNWGLQEMRGEFFTFVDSDDWLDLGAIEYLYRMIEKQDAAVAGMGFQMDSTPGIPAFTSCDPSCSETEAFVMSNTDFLREKLLYGDSRCWSKLYRSSVRNEVCFDCNYTIGEDMLFVLDFLRTPGTVVLSEKTLYYYYQNTGGAMQRPFKASAMDQVTCWLRAKQMYAEVEGLEADSNPGIYEKLDSIILISVLLTAGRIAELPVNGWKEFEKQIHALSHDYLKNCYSREAFRLLDLGYRIKVSLFRTVPKLYLRAYHLWKTRGKK